MSPTTTTATAPSSSADAATTTTTTSSSSYLTKKQRRTQTFASSSSSSRLTTSPLYAFKDNKDNEDDSTPITTTPQQQQHVVEERKPSTGRRDIFRWFRRAAVIGAGSSTGSALRRSATAATAAAATTTTTTTAINPEKQKSSSSSSTTTTTSTTPGRIVELQVANLQGNADQTGTIRIQLEPTWAPRGVERFEDLTAAHFWKDCRIFRVLPGFVCQFGINGNPATQSLWRSRNLPDDPVRVSNTRGTVVFATAGPNSRTTQLFVNTADNAFLDRQGFAPIGKVVSGMEYVDQFYAGYGEGAPAGRGPNQGFIQAKGNAYLQEQFPKLSYISNAGFVE